MNCDAPQLPDTVGVVRCLCIRPSESDQEQWCENEREQEALHRLPPDMLMAAGRFCEIR
jgi:hypothetical protein